MDCECIAPPETVDDLLEIVDLKIKKALQEFHNTEINKIREELRKHLESCQ